MIRFINLLTGRRWWYNVEVEYLDNTGRIRASCSVNVGLINRSDILNTRDRKKEVARHFIPQIKRRNLCNGYLVFRVSAYLGWLKIQGGRHGFEMAMADFMGSFVGMLLERGKR